MGDLDDGISEKIQNSETDSDSMARSISSSALSAISDSEWRNELNPIRSKLEYALKHELLTDLTCIVGTGANRTEIRCHSLILRLQSAAFDRKFVPAECVELPKYDAATFNKFLVFLYTEKFNATVEEAISLLYIAKGFEVNHLVERCSKLLKTEINVENASVFYMKANEYEEHQLEEHAKKFILRHAEAVCETQGFLKLTHVCLEALLRSSDKNVDDVSAFKAMIRWSKAECERENLEPTAENLQYVLKGCIELINYLEFSPEEFSEFVVPSHIMSAECSLKYLTELTLKGKHQKQQFNLSPAPFSRSRSTSRSRTSVRLSATESETLTLQRFKSVANECWSEGGTEKISIKCSKAIQLVGLGLYGRASPNNCNIDTTVIVSTYDEVGQLAACHKIVEAPASGGIFNINLDAPVTLAENVWYTLTIKMDGDMFPYGTGGKKKYEGLHLGHDKLNFEFKNPKGVAGASTAKGQIPNLIFKT